MDYTNSLAYQTDIENAYMQYLKLYPLDLLSCSEGDPALMYWRSKIQYDISEFSRQLYYLQISDTLDEFVHISSADFDNCAAIIKVVVNEGMIELDNGKIIANSNSSPSKSSEFKAKETFQPNSDYNQFPCDNKSVLARVQLLQNRYPGTKHINFGLIGDDDFVSIELSRVSQFNITVIEKDERIISTINDQRCTNIKIEDFDIMNVLTQEPPKTLQSFMTDPPYTVHGSLAFIYCGLSRMRPRKDNSAEFYVILNPTMMGRNLRTVLKVLSDAGICLKDVDANFSQYKLPSQFPERQRANEFLESIGVNADHALHYSSSSTVYTFELTEDYNMQILKDFIKPAKMYEHYAN